MTLIHFNTQINNIPSLERVATRGKEEIGRGLSGHVLLRHIISTRPPPSLQTFFLDVPELRQKKKYVTNEGEWFQVKRVASTTS
jgi:hypothetical protein